MRLPVHDQRIDCATHIVDRSIADHLNDPCISIDLDLADMRPVRKTGDRQCLVTDPGEWPSQIVRQILASKRGSRNFKQVNLPVGARNAISSGGEFNVRLPRFQQKTGNPASLSMISPVALPMIVAASFIDRPECEPPPTFTQAESCAT